jgi:hypothetical protein
VLSLNVNHVQERGLLGIAIEINQQRVEGKRKCSQICFLTEARYIDNGNVRSNSNASNCDIQECVQNQFNNRLYRYEYKDNKLVNPKLLIDIPIYWNNRVYPTIYPAIINGESKWRHYPLREGIHQGGKLVMVMMTTYILLPATVVVVSTTMAATGVSRMVF